MMIEQRLAAAIRANDFEAANFFAERFGAQVVADLKSAPDNDTRESIYRHALDTLDQNLHLARVLRAHLAAEIQTNSGPLRYEASETALHQWQIRA